MADQLTTNPNAPRDWAGDIVPGALLYAYASGTTTPLTIYADAAATIPHPSPLAADGNGVFPQIFYTGAVKITVTDPDGVVLPGFPLDPAPRSVVDTSGANTISFLPTPSIPETDVQKAIERVDANFSDFGRALVGDNNAAEARETLGLQLDGTPNMAVNPGFVPTRGAVGAAISTAVATIPAAGAVRSFAFAAYGDPATSTGFGSIVAGSSLMPTGAMYRGNFDTGTTQVVADMGAALNGSWVCLGVSSSVTVSGTASISTATLWQRVA